MMIDALGPSVIRSPAIEPQGAAFVGNLAPLTPPTVQPSNFTDMLAGMIGETASAVKTAETASISAVHGKANIQQVAEAVLAAEMTLQSAIAVRDKVTAAYLELSRMAI
jgi:flagellar hook-basal body complex protein FliE